jgi:ferredoxin-NADP reductase
MLTPTVFEVAFETDKPFTFVAGQFCSIIIPGAGPKGRDLRRAYSIASAPEMNPIELCVKVVEAGPGTQYLYHLRPGDHLRMVAPYGDFVYKPQADRGICFIATGTGIAPFRSIVLSRQYSEALPKNAYCFFGVRSEEELVYLDLFEKHPSIHFVSAVSQASDKWQGFRGRVTDYIKTLGNSFPWLEMEYYLCGHGGMIQEVKTMLMGIGVTKDSIHQEIYYK